MLTTYYRTPDPGQSEDSEYFQLYIRADEEDGVVIYFLDENHGWFRDGRRAIDHRTIFTDGSPTFAEAEELLKDQVRSLAATGYVHAFSRDPMAEKGIRYEQIDPSKL
jgi:hypothetical protein